MPDYRGRGVFAAIALAGLTLGAALPASAQQLDLAELTCGQVGAIAPESVQLTVIGLSVGYAMGEKQADFSLGTANGWFAAFRELCGKAPQAKVVEVLPLLADHAAAQDAK